MEIKRKKTMSKFPRNYAFKQFVETHKGNNVTNETIEKYIANLKEMEYYRPREKDPVRQFCYDYLAKKLKRHYHLPLCNQSLFHFHENEENVNREDDFENFEKIKSLIKEMGDVKLDALRENAFQLFIDYSIKLNNLLKIN